MGHGKSLKKLRTLLPMRCFIGKLGAYNDCLEFLFSLPERDENNTQIKIKKKIKIKIKSPFFNEKNP